MTLQQGDDDRPRGTDPKTADRLRKDIDRGRTGDKVGYPDPAAAPLGTDAEAGGHPPTDEELRMVRRAERPRGGGSAPSEDRSRGRPNSAEDG